MSTSSRNPMTPHTRPSARRITLEDSIDRLQRCDEHQLRDMSLSGKYNKSYPLDHASNLLTSLPYLWDQVRLYKSLESLSQIERLAVTLKWGLGKDREDGTVEIALPRSTWSMSDKRKRRYCEILSEFTRSSQAFQSVEEILERSAALQLSYSESNSIPPESASTSAARSESPRISTQDPIVAHQSTTFQTDSDLHDPSDYDSSRRSPPPAQDVVNVPKSRESSPITITSSTASDNRSEQEYTEQELNRNLSSRLSVISSLGPDGQYDFEYSVSPPIDGSSPSTDRTSFLHPSPRAPLSFTDVAPILLDEPGFDFCCLSCGRQAMPCDFKLQCPRVACSGCRFRSIKCEVPEVLEIRWRRSWFSLIARHLLEAVIKDKERVLKVSDDTGRNHLTALLRFHAINRFIWIDVTTEPLTLDQPEVVTQALACTKGWVGVPKTDLGLRERRESWLSVLRCVKFCATSAVASDLTLLKSIRQIIIHE